MRFLLLLIVCLIFENLGATSYIENQIKHLEEYKALVLKRSKIFSNIKKISCDNLSLTVGECFPDMPELRTVLMIKGFLFDHRVTDDFIFDESLKNAVQQFQKQNLFSITGIFDSKTCKALNQSFQDEVQMIEKNITRLKILKEKVQNKEKLVLINIPEFRLFCISENNIEKTINVIVGKMGRETNLMHDQISSILINPSWTIPKTILVKDKLKIFSKKPKYLATHGYVVLDQDGDELDPNSIDWNDVKKNPTFYRFRQMPGKKNALGLFKFVLNNPENIHIHGTNDQKLFDQNNRSLSSGCIRLEDPKTFATWLLKDQQETMCKTLANNPSENCLDKLLREKIQRKNTQQISLNKPMNVIFSYITMWVDENGQVFKSDPYAKDMNL
ncbi:MAG: hypothetical protein HEEMFOPI_00603 [Holosporales bacterium]